MPEGENNAWTNNDITNYYLLHQNVETGFWLESDHAQLGFQSEKSGSAAPGGDWGVQTAQPEPALRGCIAPFAWTGIRIASIPLADYRKEIAHIAQATLEEVKDFSFRFMPNNAILAVAGHISFEETIRLAEKWFARDSSTEHFLPTASGWKTERLYAARRWNGRCR